MAKRKSQSAAALTGAEEFAGADAEKEAIEKIAAAKAAAAKEAEADKKKGDNGGPLMDEDAWKRACLEYTAEMLEMEDLDSKKAEIAGRISSIRKVAKKCKVDWDLVKRYYDDHKVIRKGGMGAMVTDERRYRQLLKLMGSPLGTQFTLWDVEPDSPRARPASPAWMPSCRASTPTATARIARTIRSRRAPRPTRIGIAAGTTPSMPLFAAWARRTEPRRTDVGHASRPRPVEQYRLGDVQPRA